MPNPTPISYGTACPSTETPTNPVATLNSGQNFPVNFSGVPDATTNNPSKFTVGGWVRRLSPSSAGTVFVVNGQFTLTMDSAGVLTAAVGNAQLASEIPIADVHWHYVAVTYLPSSETNQTGVLTIYIDGLPGAGAAVNVTTPGQGSGCYLGAQGAPFEFESWTIWSEALPSDVIGAPQWGDPPAGTPEANGLVAAFDFGLGLAEDISGNNYPVSVAALTWHIPCMQVMPGGGVAIIEATDVNPGGGSGTPAAFSILGWTCVPRSPSPPANYIYPIFVNGNAALSVRLSTDATGTLSAGYWWQVGATPQQSATYQTPVIAGDWVHCALTWDGQHTVTFYLNGSVANTQQITATAFSTQEPVIGDSPGSFYIQGVSIWSTCLAQTAIQQCMLGADPTLIPGCVANFALLTDLGDSINGDELVVNNNSCQITDLVTPLLRSEAVPATDIPKPVALDGPRLLSSHDLIAIARKNGIDVDTPLSAADMAGPDYAGIGQWVDGLTAWLPANAAARLKNDFLRHVRIGLEMRQKGIKAGTFTMAVEGGDTVGYYHTEAGPQEVFRITGVLTMPQWAMTVIFDVISLIASMFGIVTTAAKVTNAIGILEPEINQLINAIKLAYNVSDSQIVIAQKVGMAVLGVMYSGNLTYTIVKQIVMGSWWSLAFTVTNTVLMLAALVITNGAAIAIRVLQMGVQLATLVYDLQQMPQSEAAAAS